MLYLKILTIIIFLENIFFYIFALNDFDGFLKILLIHFFASFIFSVFIFILVPKSYRKKTHVPSIFLFIILVSVFSSIYGIVFIPLVMFIGLRKQYESFDLEIQEVEVDYYIQSYPDVYRKFREGSLYNIANDKNMLYDNKLKAITLLAKQENATSVNILKKLTLDSHEEVRLFSYSSISKFEKSITNKISFLNKKIQKENNLMKKASYAKSLSFLYWDLIYMGLNEKEMFDFIIGMVKKYAFIALEILKDDEFIYILLGKMYIKTKNYSEAEKYFLMAIRIGNVKLKVIPYLAEIYFYTKQTDKIVDILKKNKDLLMVDQRVAKIVDIWVGDKIESYR